MGNVVLEAMACACPVIVPKAGGIPSLVEHGKTGILYQPRNVNDAVQAVRSVLSDDGLRNRLGQSARDVVAGWDWAHSIDRVRDVYRQSIREYRASVAHVTFAQRLAQTVTFGLVSAFKSISTPTTVAPRRRRRKRRVARRALQTT